MSKNAYEIVAQSVKKHLENWEDDWREHSYSPVSLGSGADYGDLNRFLLSLSALSNGYESPVWGTYRQIMERGGNVVRGSKGTLIVLYKRLKSDIELMHYFTVFNVEQAVWETEPTTTIKPAKLEPTLSKFIGSDVANFIELLESNPKSIIVGK